MEEKSTASFELLRGSQRGKGLEELLMEIGRGAQSGCYKERRERTFQRSHSESELPIPGSIQAHLLAEYCGGNSSITLDAWTPRKVRVHC